MHEYQPHLVKQIGYIFLDAIANIQSQCLPTTGIRIKNPQECFRPIPRVTPNLKPKPGFTKNYKKLP